VPRVRGPSLFFGRGLVEGEVDVASDVEGEFFLEVGVAAAFVEFADGVHG